MTSVSKTLKKSELKKLEKRFSSWKFAPDYTKATVTLVFKRHVDAVVFIARLAIHAEVLGHHPEILLTAVKVKVTTSTNKSLTALDITLMERIEKILRSGG